MKSLRLVLVLAMAISSAAFALSLTEKDMTSIENFIRSEVEWSYEDVDGSTLFLELNEKSITVSVEPGSDSDKLNVSAVAEVETNFYGEMEIGKVTCELLLEKKGNSLKVNYLKSSCKCEAGIQCGEGNLYDE